jgi:hypothetical protein
MTDPSEHGRDPRQPYQPQHAPPHLTHPDLTASFPAIPAAPPPPSPQLPDFKPRGMSTLDKVFGWLILFTIIIFGMILASHYLLRPLAPTLPAHFTVICSTSKHVPKGSLMCKS